MKAENGMALHQSTAVFIEAQPEEILAVLADVESLPRWSPQHRMVTVLSRDEQGRPLRVKTTMGMFGFSDTNVLECFWADDGMGWTLVKSRQQRSQNARYTLIPEEQGTRVAFDITVEPLIPLPELLLGKARKEFARTATERLRDRVLSLRDED